MSLLRRLWRWAVGELKDLQERDREQQVEVENAARDARLLKLKLINEVRSRR